MELITRKDVNPHDFTLIKSQYGSIYHVVQAGQIKFDFPNHFYDTFLSLLSMAKSHYDFVNKQGSFSDPDDLNGIL